MEEESVIATLRHAQSTSGICMNCAVNLLIADANSNRKYEFSLGKQSCMSCHK